MFGRVDTCGVHLVFDLAELAREASSHGGAFEANQPVLQVVYQLEYSDWWIEHITFDYALLLLPKSWKRIVAWIRPGPWVCVPAS